MVSLPVYAFSACRSLMGFVVLVSVHWLAPGCLFPAGSQSAARLGTGRATACRARAAGQPVAGPEPGTGCAPASRQSANGPSIVGENADWQLRCGCLASNPSSRARLLGSTAACAAFTRGGVGWPAAVRSLQVGVGSSVLPSGPACGLADAAVPVASYASCWRRQPCPFTRCTPGRHVVRCFRRVLAASSWLGPGSSRWLQRSHTGVHVASSRFGPSW